MTPFWRPMIALPICLTMATAPGVAADLSCNGLVPPGTTMICAGFEPNWAVEFTCGGAGMQSTFIDAFSGDAITRTPGSVEFSGEDPWRYRTSHGIAGTITHTPGGCQDESDRMFDFHHVTQSVPGFDGRVADFCCRFR